MTTKILVVLLLCICAIRAQQTAEQIARAQAGRGYYDNPTPQQNQPGRQYDSTYQKEREEQNERAQKGRGYYDFPQGGQAKPYGGERRGVEDLNRDQGRMPFEHGPGGQYRPQRNRDWTVKPGEQQKQQVQYVYNLQTSTGIPGSSKQHSGLRMVAKLTWFNVNEDICLLKMTEIKVGEIKNRPLTDPSKISFDFGSTIELVNAEGRQQDKLQMPVKFTCNRGNVHNIVFDAEDEPWSMNIKRGILNLFRVNMRGKGQGPDSEDEFETLTHVDRMRKSNNDFFRIMEENVEGDCETDYNVMKLFPVGGGRHDIYNVTKSINLKSCRKRPLIKYNFRFSENCESDETCDSNRHEKKPKEHFLKPTSNAVYTLLGSRNRFLITNAELKSQYTFPLFNEKSDNIVTYVTQKIDMLRSNMGQVQMEEPRNPMRSKSGNMYSNEWDEAYEKHQMQDRPEPLRRMSATHDFTNRQDQAKFLLTNLVQILKSQNEKRNQNRDETEAKEDPLQLMTKLITLLRTCSSHELDQISSFLSSPQHARSGGTGQPDEASLMLSILPNILAICGTKACVKHLVDQIKQNRYSPVGAALALEGLMKMQTPSAEIITDLMKLAHDEGRNQPYLLKQMTWLVLGSLMNALCNGRHDHWATEMYHGSKPCPRQLKERYVQLAAERLQSSPKWEDALIYMKSLSNAGLANSVPLLEKIITSKDQRISPMLKSAAVYALIKLPKTKANNVPKILTPILTNAKEPTGLRIAAANILLQSNPDQSTFDHMVNQIQNDKNLELTSFLYTAIKALSKSTNPCEKKIAQDAHMALQKVRNFKKDCHQFSKFKRITLHDPFQNAGIDLEMVSSFSNMTKTGRRGHQQQSPQHLALNIHSHFFGLWNKNLFSLGVVSDGMDQVFGRAFKTFGQKKPKNPPRGSSLDDIWSHGLGSKKSKDENDLGDMFSSMTEEYPDQEPSRRDSKGVVYLKYKDQNIGFLPISHEALQSTILYMAPKMFQLERQLQNGLPLDLAKVFMLDQMFYKIPTSSGLPISVQIKVPAIVRLSGQLKATRASPTSMKAFKAMADLEFSLDTNFMIDNEIWSPIINHGLRLDHKLKQYQPIKASLNLDLNKEKTMAQLVIRQPTEKTNLLTLETAPVTYTNLWLKFAKNLDHPDEKVIPGEELSKTKYHVNKCFEELLTGGKMCLKGEMHNIMIDITGNTPAVPLSGRNKLVLSIEPSPDAREDAVINLSAKILKSGRGMGLGGSRHSELPGDSAQNNYSPSQKYQRNEEEPEDEYLQSGNKNVMASKVRLEGSTSTRRFALDLFHMFDLPRGQSKFQMNLMRESRQSREPFLICLDTDVRCQMCGEVQEEEKCGKCLAFNMALNWGQSCNSNNFISARLQPVDENTEVSESEDFYEPVCEGGRCPLSSKRREKPFRGQQGIPSKQGRRFKLVIGYNHVPVSIKNVTNKMYRFFKHHYFPQADVAQINVRNPDKKITAWINVDPKNEDQSDIIVKMPTENSTFINVPTPIDLTCTSEFGGSSGFGPPRKVPHGFRKKEIEERPEEVEEEEEEEQEPEEREKPEEGGGWFGRKTGGGGWFGGKPEKNEDFFTGQPSRGQKRSSKSKFARKTEYGYEKRKERPEEEDYEKGGQFGRDNEEDFFGRKPESMRNPFERSQYKKGGDTWKTGENQDWFGTEKYPRGKKTGQGYETNEEYEDYTSEDQFSKYSRKGGKRQSEDEFDQQQERYPRKGYLDEPREPRDREYDQEDQSRPSDSSWFGQKSTKYSRRENDDFDDNQDPRDRRYSEYDQEEKSRPEDRGWFGLGQKSSKYDRRNEDFDEDQESEDRPRKHGGHGHLSVKKHRYDKEDYDWYDTCQKDDIRPKGSECPCKKGKNKRFGGENYEEDTSESDQWKKRYGRPDESDQWEKRYGKQDESDQWEKRYGKSDESNQWEKRYGKSDESNQWEKRYGRSDESNQLEKRYGRQDQDQESEKWERKYNRPDQSQDQYEDTDYYTQRKLRHSCNQATGEGCGGDSYRNKNEGYNYDDYNRRDHETDERRKERWNQDRSRKEEDYYKKDDWEPKDENDWPKKRTPEKYDDYEKHSNRDWTPEKEHDDEDEEEEEQPKERSAFKDVFEKFAGSKKQERRDSYDSGRYSQEDDEQGKSWASEFTEDDDDDDDPPGDDPQETMPNSQNKDKYKETEETTKKEYGTRGTTCTANDQNVKTLDNVQYKFPISKCFAILTRDCSPNREFAVMMRKVDEKEQTKEILVLTRGHKFLIKPQSTEGATMGKNEQQGQSIVLNGKKYMTQEDVENYKSGEKLIKISQESGKIFIEITKVGLKVDFDGQTVNLEFPNDAAKKQCGLCGQSMEEKSKTGQKQWPNTNDPNYVRQLFMIYVIKDARCLQGQQVPTGQGPSGQQPLTAHKLKHNEGLGQSTSYSKGRVDSQEYENEYGYKEEHEESGFGTEEPDEYKGEKRGGKELEPVRAHGVMESGDQICISIIPLHKCGQNSYPEKEIEKPVGYFCISRSDPRATQIRKQANSKQVIQGLQNLSPTTTRTETFPTKCIRGGN